MKEVQSGFAHPLNTLLTNLSATKQLKTNIRCGQLRTGATIIVTNPGRHQT